VPIAEGQGHGEQMPTDSDWVISTIVAKRFALIPWWASEFQISWLKGCARSFLSGRFSQLSIWSMSMKSRATIGWL
jgi:hypothetical protein